MLNNQETMDTTLQSCVNSPALSVDRVLNSLLDRAGAPPGQLPERLYGWWDRLIDIAAETRILLPLISHLLGQYGDILPKNLVQYLQGQKIAHKTRNTLLLQQIRSLAERFRKEAIPVMFLKGAAGLVRGLYRADERVLTDIDIFVPSEKLEHVLALLTQLGYRPTPKTVPPFHHHLEPYSHPALVGQVEIHIEPYDLTMLSRPAIETIWDDSEDILLNECPVTVPSLTDHAWILIRSAFTEKVFLPRYMDAYELAIIESTIPGGIHFSDIMARARRRHLAPLVGGFSFCAEYYFGISLPVPFNHDHVLTWNNWSNALYRAYGNEHLVPMYRKRFLLMKFAVESGIISKYAVLRWLIRYEELYDKLRPGKQSFFVGRTGRLLKDISSYLLCDVEFAFRRLLPQAPIHRTISN